MPGNGWLSSHLSFISCLSPQWHLCALAVLWSSGSLFSSCQAFSRLPALSKVQIPLFVLFVSLFPWEFSDISRKPVPCRMGWFRDSVSILRRKLKRAIPREEPKEHAECMEKHVGSNATVHFQSQSPLRQRQALGQNAGDLCLRPAGASLGQANGEPGFMGYRWRMEQQARWPALLILPSNLRIVIP